MQGAELAKVKSGRANAGRVVSGAPPGVPCLVQPSDPDRVVIAAAPEE